MGRPTILVPEHIHELEADRIVVAWKAAREVRLVVRDAALLFFTRASEVTIIAIYTSDEQGLARQRVHDAAKYLHAHGAKCQTDVHVGTAESDASPVSLGDGGGGRRH